MTAAYWQGAEGYTTGTAGTSLKSDEMDRCLFEGAGSSWGTSVLLPADYVAEHVELGNAVTSFRAQGLTTDTARVLVDSTMTRETRYLAMTWGRDTNVAYDAVDKPGASHDGPHPGENDEVTVRGVLTGVLQHVGFELSAHETIGAAAQRDRWASLVRASGLNIQQAEVAVELDAFGPLTAELRRAEGNHHDLAVLLPRLGRARNFGDADDNVAVMRHRLTAATARPAGAGCPPRSPRRIAGLVLEVFWSIADDMRQALDERRELITQRAELCSTMLLPITRSGSRYSVRLPLQHRGMNGSCRQRRQLRRTTTYTPLQHRNCLGSDPSPRFSASITQGLK